jgi:hypothetical protein
MSFSLSADVPSMEIHAGNICIVVREPKTMSIDGGDLPQLTRG